MKPQNPSAVTVKEPDDDESRKTVSKKSPTKSPSKTPGGETTVMTSPKESRKRKMDEIEAHHEGASAVKKQHIDPASLSKDVPSITHLQESTEDKPTTPAPETTSGDTAPIPTNGEEISLVGKDVSEISGCSPCLPS
jgi:hypothetical protein